MTNNNNNINQSININTVNISQCKNNPLNFDESFIKNKYINTNNNNSI